MASNINGGTINWSVRLSMDQSSLNSIKSDLQKVQQEIDEIANSGDLTEELEQVRQSAIDLQNILTNSWNTNLQQLDLSRFNAQVKESYGSITNLKSSFESAGTSGVRAYNALASSVLSSNLQLKESNKILDAMSQSLTNAVTWGIASSVFNRIANSAMSAWSYVQRLDTSLNDIRIVTEKSAEDMAAFAQSANDAAQALGASTVDYSNAALIYYQQGLSDEEAKARTEVTLKTANVTGQSTAQVSEQLTAVWNGYNVSTEDAEEAIDILAAVAAATAADLEELSTGMSKVASAASTLGVTESQLASQIATIVSTTREAPETVGSGLKTIYARLSNIQAGTNEDDDTTLKSYTEKMNQLGFSVLDANNNLRDMGDVIEEIGYAWEDLTREQQISLAQTMAGTWQYNKLLALFDNWDEYVDTMEVANNSTGTLQKQQEIYMDSIAAHLQQLETAAEGVYTTLSDTGFINTLIDGFTFLINTLNNFLSGLNNIPLMFGTIGAVGAKIFSSQISSGIGRQLQNSVTNQRNKENLETVQEVANAGVARSQSGQDSSLTEAYKSQVNRTKELLDLTEQLDSEEYNRLTNLNTEITQLDLYLAILKDIADSSDIDATPLEITKGQLKDIKDEATTVQDTFDNLFTGISFQEIDGKEVFKDFNHDFIEQWNSIRGTNITQKLTDEQKQSLQEISNKVMENAADEEDYNKVLEIRNQIAQKYTDEIREQERLINQIKPLDGQNQTEVEARLKERQQSFEDQTKIIQQQKAIQTLIDTASNGYLAFSSFYSVYHSLINEDLSPLEKATQVFSGLIIAIPALVSAIKNARVAWQAMSVVIDLVKTKTTALIAVMKNAKGIIGLVITGAILALSYAIYKISEASQAAQKNLERLQEEVEVMTDRFKEATDAVDDFTEAISNFDDAVDALEELEEGTDEYTEALKEANEQAKELIETYGLWGDYHYESGKIVIDEAALETKEAELEAEAVTAKKLYYTTLIGENSAELQVDLKTLGLDEITTYTASGGMDETMDVDDWKPILDWLNKTTDQGQTYSDVIVQALEQMTDEEIKSLTSTLNSKQLVEKTSSFITDTLGLEIDEADGDITKYLRTIILQIDDINTFDDMSKGMSEENAYYVDQILQAIGSENYGTQFEKYSTDKEGNVDSTRVSQLEGAYAGFFKGLVDEEGISFQERVESIDVSDVNRYGELRDYDEYSDITSENDLYLEYLTTGLGMTIEAATEALSAAGEDIYEVTDSEGNAIVSEDISTTDMMQALARIAEINNIVDDFSDQINGEAADNYVNALGTLVNQTGGTSDFYGVDFAGAILDGMSGGAGQFDLSTILSYLSEDQAAALGAGEGNKISYDDFMRLFGFDPSDTSQKTAFADFCKELGFTGGQAAYDGFNEAIDEYDADAFWDNLYSSASKGASAATNLMADIQSGDVTSENLTESEDYEELISSLAVLQQQYPNLRDEVELLNSTWLVGTNAYYEALSQVQDLMVGLKIQDMNNDLQDTIDELSDENGEINLELIADSDAFDDAMEDIMNQDYQITVEVLTELDNEFNSTVSALENLETMASKIGDSYIVAASDITELNNAFPGILEGYQLLADGTIQLNQEMVQSAINAAETSAQADINATKQKLEDAKSEFEIKRAAYLAIAQAAEAMANSTVDSDDDAATQRGIISDALLNITNANAALSAIFTDEKNVDIATSSQTNAGILAMNYQEAWQSVSDSAYDAAVNSATYMADIAAGVSPSEKLTVGINYQGSNGQTSDIQEAEEKSTDPEDFDFLAEFDKGNYNSTKNAAMEMVAAMDTAINTVTGEIVELEARGQALDYSLNNIAAGGSGSGSSSGSDSGSEKDPDVEEYLEDELDLYHDINLELETIDRNLSRLQKRESKLTGQALLENLNAQIETLNNQIDATNRKLEIAKGELADIRAELSAQGVTFDENGYISNYTEMYESRLAYYNSLVDQYNAMSADAQDTFKDTLDQAKDDFDSFVEKMEDYDELISETIPDLEDDIQDAIDEQIEIQIEKFTASIEIRLDMTEAEQDWNEFYRRVILGIDDDDIFSGAVQNLADLLSYFNTAATELAGDTAEDWLEQIQAAIGKDGTGLIQSLTQQVTDTLEQLAQIDATGTSSVYGDDYASALEDLQNYNEELMDNLINIEDLIDEISEAYLDMIDEAIDAFDEQVEQYEYINDLLKHDLEIVDLLYGEDAYAEMSKYYAQIEANNNKQLDFLRQRVNYAYEMMQAETDDEAREKWQEEWENALSELNDTVEEALENIIDKYSNTINQIISELNDAITDGLGLSYISDEWDLINSKADIYLDTVNSVYAVQSLQQKYLDAIDDTDSISAQQKLNAVMEEQLSYLQEKENLTQYDIDRAEKVYELTLAQIALEEAQQNKSTMRLRRDSQGNYSYEFVADEDKIAEAYQNLLDLQNELYNFDLDAYQDNLDEIYSMYEEFQEKILELYEDQTLSAEEREEQIALYVEYYGDIINSLVEENSTIRTNLTGSAIASIMDMMNAGMDEMLAAYGINTESFEAMTNEQLAAFRLMTEEQLAAFKLMSEEEQDELMNSLVPAWDSGIQHMADTFAGEGGLVAVCKDALNDLNQATEDYQDSLDELEKAAGIDLTSIANGYDNASSYAKALLQDNTDLITSFQDELLAIQDVISAVEDLRDVYNEAATAAKKAAEEAYGYTQAANSDSASALSNSNSSSSSSSSSSVSSVISSISSGSSSSGSASGSAKNKGTAPTVEEGVAAAIWIYPTAGWGTGTTRKNRLADKNVSYSGVQAYLNSSSKQQYLTDTYLYGSNAPTKDELLAAYQYGAFKTGGYTGEWNDNDSLDGGKLAVLHQKELVLNAADTENLLSAVSVVRDITSLLNNIDSSIFNKLYHYIDGLSSVQAYEPSDTLEQNVHIEANFPNVTNSNEIENAFNNLVNVASMYANKKNR